VAPQDIEEAVDSMVAVMHGPRGTARASAQGAQWTIAGKTGTAQVIGIAQGADYDESLVDERHRPHALFIAFAPAENPRIAVSVLVENGASGSGAAAPIARVVIDNWLMREND
jgi:penicillin-binding protein 2